MTLQGPPARYRSTPSLSVVEAEGGGDYRDPSISYLDPCPAYSRAQLHQDQEREPRYPRLSPAHHSRHAHTGHSDSHHLSPGQDQLWAHEGLNDIFDIVDCSPNIICSFVVTFSG